MLRDKCPSPATLSHAEAAHFCAMTEDEFRAFAVRHAICRGGNPRRPFFDPRELSSALADERQENRK